MKLLLLVASLILLISTSNALHKFAESHFRNSDDVFEYVSNADHEIYVLFIYNGNWAAHEIQHPMKAKYDLERSALLEVIQKYGNHVHFSEINVNNGDFTSLIQEAGISSLDLDQYPVTVVIDDGHGFWVQGPREYHRIAAVIDEFAANPDSHWY